MKKHYNKTLVMNKEDDADFATSTKYQTCDNVNSEGDVAIRDHCHITGK